MSRKIIKNEFFIIGLIVLVIIFLHYLKILSPLEKVIYWTLAPLQITTENLAHSANNLINNNLIKHNWPEENRILTAKVETLENQLVGLKNFIEENQLIEAQKQYLSERKLNYLTARVLGRAETNNANILIINKGESDGVKVGQAVAGVNGALLGKIIKTESKIAHLWLLIANGNRFNSTLAGNSEVAGLAEGNHNTSLILDYILKNAELKTGDLIVTSGADALIPAGILIGSLGDIIDDKNNLFKQAEIISPVDFKNIKIVNVIQ
ncbi:MAG TPA: rod shape-determining protein MreC [bacterium]|nr:rod shape-determining protein MreC [bacterium]